MVGRKERRAMFETTAEVLVSGGLTGVSFMIIAGAISVTLASREGPRREIYIEAAVRNAPYYRLKAGLTGDWPTQPGSEVGNSRS